MFCKFCRVIAVVYSCFVAVAAGAAEQQCRDDTVKLRGDGKSARFSIELADEPAERAKGLMFVKSMPQSAGMLFVYPAPRPVNFWMKNTLIPLDMVFLDKKGVVQNVHANAVPHDQSPIFGGNNIMAVLEINGGLAARIGIAEGWQVKHPAFDAGDPAWPCQN